MAIAFKFENFKKELKFLEEKAEKEEIYIEKKRNLFGQVLRILKLIYKPGNYKPIEKNCWLTLNQLKKEEYLFEKYYQNISYKSIYDVRVPIRKKIILSIFLVQVIWKIITKSLNHDAAIAFYLYHRISHLENEINFVYFIFLEEVRLMLMLATSNKKLIKYHELTNFFDVRKNYLLNEIIIPFEISVNYLKRSNNFKFQKINYLISNQQIINNSLKKRINRRSIGYYAGGYYERRSQGSYKDDFLIEAIKIEELVIRRLYDVQQTNKDMALQILPHYTRNVENIKNAIKYYQKVIGNKNVGNLITTKKNVSVEEFELIITLGSNVFFDAISSGKKAIMISGQQYLQNYLNTPPLFYFTYEIQDLNYNLLNHILQQNPNEFFRERLVYA